MKENKTNRIADSNCMYVGRDDLVKVSQFLILFVYVARVGGWGWSSY